VTPKLPWRPLPGSPAQRLQRFQKYYMALLSPAMQAEDPAASTLRRRTNIDRLNVSKPRASLLGMAERVRHTILERLFPTGKVRVRVLSLMSKRRPLSTRYRIPLKAPPRCDSGEHVKSDAPATTYYAVIVRETKRRIQLYGLAIFRVCKALREDARKVSYTGRTIDIQSSPQAACGFLHDRPSSLRYLTSIELTSNLYDTFSLETGEVDEPATDPVLLALASQHSRV